MSSWFRSSAVVEWKYDDIPTVKTDEEFLQVSASAQEQVKEWISQNDWADLEQVEDIVSWEKHIPNSAIHAVKAQAILKNTTVKNVWPLFFDAPLELKKKCTDGLISSDVLRTINPNVVLTLAKFSAPFGISSREFLLLRTHEDLGNDLHYISSWSVNYEDTPFSSGFVRGTTKTGALVRPGPDPNTVTVTTVDHVDPRGSVPGTVVNMFKKKAIGRLTAMEKMILRHEI